MLEGKLVISIKMYEYLISTTLPFYFPIFNLGGKNHICAQVDVFCFYNIIFNGRKPNQKQPWASLVAQWLRICLPMQGTRVRALVWEDPTCCGATEPVSHNY